MRINSMVSSAYSNQSSIITNGSSQRSKYTSPNQTISTAKMDSFEISSEAYNLQENPTKMSATSGKDSLEITKGNSENSYIAHFKDSAMEVW